MRKDSFAKQHTNSFVGNFVKLALAALAVLAMVNISSISVNAATKNIDVTTKSSEDGTLVETSSNIYYFSLNRSGRVEFKFVTQDTGIGYVWLSEGEQDKFSDGKIFRGKCWDE